MRIQFPYIKLSAQSSSFNDLPHHPSDGPITQVYTYVHMHAMAYIRCASYTVHCATRESIGNKVKNEQIHVKYFIS